MLITNLLHFELLGCFHLYTDVTTYLCFYVKACVNFNVFVISDLDGQHHPVREFCPVFDVARKRLSSSPSEVLQRHPILHHQYRKHDC